MAAVRSPRTVVSKSVVAVGVHTLVATTSVAHRGVGNVYNVFRGLRFLGTHRGTTPNQRGRHVRRSLRRASDRTARPSRRRNMHNISELVRRSCSVEGHVVSQAPAYGPEQERKRARPGRGPAAELAVSLRSIDSYSRCSYTLLAECCQPCRHSLGTLLGASAAGGGAPSHSACHEGRACIPRASRVCPAHAAAKMPCGMPCAMGP